MPVQFYISVNYDPKQEKLNKKEFKQSLQQFSQVFKLFENFKAADLSELKPSQGMRDLIYVSEKGRKLDYSSQSKTIKRAEKMDKQASSDLTMVFNSQAPSEVKVGKPHRLIPVKDFEEPDSVGEIQMPLCHLGIKTDDGKGFKSGG